jgi:hypothetical protein
MISGVSLSKGFGRWGGGDWRGAPTSGVWQSDLSSRSKSVSMRPHNKSLNLATISYGDIWYRISPTNILLALLSNLGLGGIINM